MYYPSNIRALRIIMYLCVFNRLFWEISFIIRISSRVNFTVILIFQLYSCTWKDLEKKVFNTLIIFNWRHLKWKISIYLLKYIVINYICFVWNAHMVYNAAYRLHTHMWWMQFFFSTIDLCARNYLKSLLPPIPCVLGAILL